MDTCIAITPDGLVKSILGKIENPCLRQFICLIHAQSLHQPQILSPLFHFGTTSARQICLANLLRARQCGTLSHGLCGIHRQHSDGISKFDCL